MDSEPFVLCDNLVKIFKVADLEVVALQGLNLELRQGEMMALVGPSGAGKSTLLNVIGGLDTPSAGEVSVGGWDLLKMKKRDRVKFQRQVVGFVWQQTSRNLLPYLSARENVELPMVINRVKSSRRKKRAMELLDMVGLADHSRFRPDQLSGGQQQRVALAVALANNPPLLLGDEMTGQIDSAAAARVFDSLRAINHAYNTTVIVVTHDPNVASRVDRVVAIRDGRTSTEIRRSRNQDDGSVQEEEWVILDQAARMQLPHAYVDTLEMKERVKVRLEPDHVSVWPQSNGNQKALRGLQPDPTHPTTLPVSHTAITTTINRSTGVPIVTKNLSRFFEMGVEEIHAIREVNINIPTGTLALLKGPSGSGKTTLLNLIAGLDDPTAGTVLIGERALNKMSSRERIDLRRRQIGFVFQTFGLLPFLSVEENVEVSLRLLRASHQERRALTDQVLEMVGLADRAKHRTYELSGGEQQRVAIARALVKRPVLVLADEPTGQLDTLTGASIITLLKEVTVESGVTVVVASHDPNVQEVADLVFELQDGHLDATIDKREGAQDLFTRPKNIEITRGTRTQY